jgi:hypothetical protein
MKSLAKAMNAMDFITFFGDEVMNIPPSIFGIKSNSYESILKDYFALRRSIKNCGNDLIIPHYNLRWKAILFPKRFTSVCGPSNNIYISYRKFYNLKKVENFKINNTSKVVYLYPESRQTSKVIVPELCEKISKAIGDIGLECKQVILKNSIYRHNKNIETTFVENFEELIDTIHLSRFIVSADSLPVHISYWKKRICYVFSPNMNYKMFTDLIIENGSWSLFNDINKFEVWLKVINEH